MENNAKGTRYGIRNSSEYRWYCSNHHQYNGYFNQYQPILPET